MPKFNIFLALTLTLIFSVNAEELPRESVVKLVLNTPRYSGDDYTNWTQAIKSQDGINPDLLAMIKSEKDWELLGIIFSALAARNDLQPNELLELKKPLAQISETTEKNDMMGRAYTRGVLAVLKNYPSTENENTLLSFINRGGGHWNLTIAESLGQIGTARSIEALVQMEHDMKPPVGRNYKQDIVRQAITNIERRQTTEQRRLDHAKKLNDSTSSSSTEHTDNSQHNSEFFATRSFNISVFAFFAIITCMIIHLLRKRRTLGE